MLVIINVMSNQCGIVGCPVGIKVSNYKICIGDKLIVKRPGLNPASGIVILSGNKIGVLTDLLLEFVPIKDIEIVSVAVPYKEIVAHFKSKGQFKYNDWLEIQEAKLSNT